MRIGILGGTFNPIHIGHLILAEEALRKLRLDKIIFMPAYIPPHKPKKGVASSLDRYRMANLAIHSNPRFEASKMEIEAKGKSYSIETIKKFRKGYPKSKIFFITGADSLRDLFSWKDVREIFKLSNFVIAKRPGYLIKNVPRQVKTMSIIEVDISSSLIRRRIANGKSIRYLVPGEVAKYIQAKGLYKQWKKKKK